MNRLFKRILIFYMAFLLSPLYAKEDVKDETLLWRTPLYVAANHYLSVSVHEGAHALSAILMGHKVRKIEINFFKQSKVHYDEEKKWTPFENYVTTLSGPIADRLLALGVDAYLDRNENHIPEFSRSFLGTTYLTSRIHFSYYIVRSYLAVLFNSAESGGDWIQFAYNVSKGDRTRFHIIMSGLCLLAVLDIVATVDEIQNNYNRTMGRYPDDSNTKKIIGWKFRF